nr:hypothetical protein CFP56_34069 [Quercus suber]
MVEFLINKIPSNIDLLLKSTRLVKTLLPTPTQTKQEHYGEIQVGKLPFVTFVWKRLKLGIKESLLP